MTTARQDALGMVVKARDAWGAGKIDEALEILDAASVRLQAGGHTPQTMPITFEMISKIRVHLLARLA